MSNFRTLVSLCARNTNRRRRERGATLAELLVVLVIVSTLAMVALPMAETAVHRRHESELRYALRTVRTAIDRFHADWSAGRMADGAEGISDAGYPVTLTVLVTGVAASEEDDPPLRYLRRVPDNPFADDNRSVASQWRLIGYAQQRGDSQWDEKDVYDLSPVTDRKALDGSDIQDW